jgi:hypothetical protein
MRVRSLACSVVFGGALAGCAVGPDYLTPDVAVPPTLSQRRRGRKRSPVGRVLSSGVGGGRCAMLPMFTLSTQPVGHDARAEAALQTGLTIPAH